jgi:ribosomal subunit interface protein
MQINITGHQITLSQELQDNVRNKLIKIVEKYFPHPIDAHIIFEHTNSFVQTEIKVHESTKMFVIAESEDKDILRSFEKCLDKIETKLRKEKSKLVDKHYKNK